MSDRLSLPAEHPVVVDLASPSDWAGFRQACRVLLAERLQPHPVALEDRRLHVAHGHPSRAGPSPTLGEGRRPPSRRG